MKQISIGGDTLIGRSLVCLIFSVAIFLMQIRLEAAPALFAAQCRGASTQLPQRLSNLYQSLIVVLACGDVNQGLLLQPRPRIIGASFIKIKIPFAGSYAEHGRSCLAWHARVLPCLDYTPLYGHVVVIIHGLD